MTENLVMLYKGCIRRKATSDNKYHHYRKMSYFKKNCTTFITHKKNKLDKL